MDKKNWKDKSQYKRDFKQDKEPKPEYSEKKEKEMEPKKDEQLSEAKINSVIPGLTLTNAALVNQGVSSNAVEFAVTDILFNPQDLISSGRFNLIESSINQVISAYAISRGITTTLVATDVRDYIRNATLALANLITLWRSQSAINMRTQRGVAVGRAFTDIIDSTTYNLTAIARNSAVTVVQTEASSISNAAWSNTYLSKVGLLRLPASLVDICLKLYGNGYSLAPYSSLMNDSIIQFRPGTTPATTGYTNAISAIEAQFLAKPDLISVLELLGFNADVVVAIDFTRDLKGLTYNIVRSEDMVFALANIGVFDLDRSNTVVSDTDVNTLLVDYTNEGSSVFSHVDMTQTSPDFAFTLLLKQFDIAENAPRMQAISKVVRSDGTLMWTTTGNLPQCAIHNPILLTTTSFSGTVADFNTVMGRLVRAFDNYESIIGFTMPYSSNYSTSGTVVADFTVTISSGPDEIVHEGANAYFYNLTEAEVLQRVVSMALVFGAFWRQDLQELLNKFSKQASTIGY